MKKLLAILVFAVSVFSYADSKNVPNGYGGISLGMSVEETKAALKKNTSFGYHGDRDVSLLPGENRVLIETDGANAGNSFLERSWFQFYNDKLYIITINVNQERMDHYSIFDSLCKKYGLPESVTPEKATWKSGEVILTLERPLTLKYTDQKTFEELQNKSLINPSGSEITREMFLEGL